MPRGRTVIWEPPPDTLRLLPSEVHVWRVELDRGTAEVAELRALLSPDERERADRFRFPQDRDRYTAARGVTRKLLGAYSGAPAESLSFAYGEHGKPRLDGSPFRFNVSHSRGLALVALALDRELGVDLEAIRCNLADEKIAERFFSPGEVVTLRSLPPEERVAAFFRCWTRKEAFIKADGRGLTLGLNSFDVSLAPNEPAALLRTSPDPEQAERWCLRALDPGDGFAGALCAEGQNWHVRCYRWPPGN